MREIKFRVYDESEGMFLVDGLVGTDKGLKVCSVLAIPERCDYECWSPIPNEWEYTSNDIIMQYTGLKDKNGVEIYEGDIVKYKEDWIGESKSYIIKWRKAGFWLLDIELDDWSMEFGDMGVNYEIIGNIYENPELLSNSETTHQG